MDKQALTITNEGSMVIMRIDGKETRREKLETKEQAENMVRELGKFSEILVKAYRAMGEDIILDIVE